MRCRAPIAPRPRPIPSGWRSWGRRSSSIMTPPTWSADVSAVVYSTAVRRPRQSRDGRRPRAGYPPGAPGRDAGRADATSVFGCGGRHAWQDHHHLHGRSRLLDAGGPGTLRWSTAASSTLYGTATPSVGEGDWIVVEGHDESDGLRSCAWKSTVAVVTNIDPEHLRPLRHLRRGSRKAFRDFVENVLFYGFAVVCLDHPEVQDPGRHGREPPLVSSPMATNPQAEVRALNVTMGPDGSPLRRGLRHPRPG